MITGKIASFYNSIKNQNDPLYDLINLHDLNVYLILYVATETAKEYLQTSGQQLFSPISFSVIVIHTILDNVKYDENKNKEFTALIKKKNLVGKTYKLNILHKVMNLNRIWDLIRVHCR